PKPRQSPDTLSVTANAARTSPAREKCAKRSLLVTELARLPTYTLGITGLLVCLERFGLSRQATLWWSGMGCIRRRVPLLYSRPGQKYMRVEPDLDAFETSDLGQDRGISLPGWKVYV